MSERCELSDLPVEQCACRKHNPTQAVTIAAEIAYQFTARFGSHCDNCDSWMKPGELISKTTDGDYLCERCQ